MSTNQVLILYSENYLNLIEIRKINKLVNHESHY